MIFVLCMVMYTALHQWVACDFCYEGTAASLHYDKLSLGDNIIPGLYDEKAIPLIKVATKWLQYHLQNLNDLVRTRTWMMARVAIRIVSMLGGLSRLYVVETRAL